MPGRDLRRIVRAAEARPERMSIVPAFAADDLCETHGLASLYGEEVLDAKPITGIAVVGYSTLVTPEKWLAHLVGNSTDPKVRKLAGRVYGRQSGEGYYGHVNSLDGVEASVRVLDYYKDSMWTDLPKIGDMSTFTSLAIVQATTCPACVQVGCIAPIPCFSLPYREDVFATPTKSEPPENGSHEFDSDYADEHAREVWEEFQEADADWVGKAWHEVHELDPDLAADVYEEAYARVLNEMEWKHEQAAALTVGEVDQFQDWLDEVRTMSDWNDMPRLAQMLYEHVDMGLISWRDPLGR